MPVFYHARAGPIGKTEHTAEELVNILKAKGHLGNQRAEAAMLVVPRDLFVPRDRHREAYRDQKVTVRMPDGSTLIMPNPSFVALALERLDLQPGCSFLDVGCGSAYVTAVAACMIGPTGVVHGIECLSSRLESARNNLRLLRERLPPEHVVRHLSVAGSVQAALGSVSLSLTNVLIPECTDGALYDALYCDNSLSEEDLPAFLSLLKPCGRMVVIIEDDALLITRSGTDAHDYTRESLAKISGDFGELEDPTPWEVQEAVQRIKVRELRKGLEQAKVSSASMTLVHAPALAHPPDINNHHMLIIGHIGRGSPCMFHMPLHLMLLPLFCGMCLSIQAETGSLRSNELLDLQTRMGAAMQRIAELETALQRGGGGSGGAAAALRPAASNDDTRAVIRDNKFRRTPRISPHGSARSPGSEAAGALGSSGACCTENIKTRTRQVRSATLATTLLPLLYLPAVLPVGRCVGLCDDRLCVYRSAPLTQRIYDLPALPRLLLCLLLQVLDDSEEPLINAHCDKLVLEEKLASGGGSGRIGTALQPPAGGQQGAWDVMAALGVQALSAAQIAAITAGTTPSSRAGFTLYQGSLRGAAVTAWRLTIAQPVSVLEVHRAYSRFAAAHPNVCALLGVCIEPLDATEPMDEDGGCSSPMRTGSAAASGHQAAVQQPAQTPAAGDMVAAGCHLWVVEERHGTQTLSARLERGVLSWQHALSIAQDVAAAVAHLQSLRRISPLAAEPGADLGDYSNALSAPLSPLAVAQMLVVDNVQLSTAVTAKLSLGPALLTQLEFALCVSPDAQRVAEVSALLLPYIHPASMFGSGVPGGVGAPQGGQAFDGLYAFGIVLLQLLTERCAPGLLGTVQAALQTRSLGNLVPRTPAAGAESDALAADCALLALRCCGTHVARTSSCGGGSGSGSGAAEQQQQPLGLPPAPQQLSLDLHVLPALSVLQRRLEALGSSGMSWEQVEELLMLPLQPSTASSDPTTRRWVRQDFKMRRKLFLEEVAKMAVDGPIHKIEVRRSRCFKDSVATFSGKVRQQTCIHPPLLLFRQRSRGACLPSSTAAAHVHCMTCSPMTASTVAGLACC
jgi:protein-L-isoaspartate O-methyltransferase